MSPARRREAVVGLQDTHDVSERRACEVVQQHRSTQRYSPRRASDEPQLIAALHQLVKQHPRRGYRYMTVLLRRDGWSVNRKRVYRLWRQEGFRVPKRQRKKRAVGVSANACD